jgi:hypothetical protein
VLLPGQFVQNAGCFDSANGSCSLNITGGKSPFKIAFINRASRDQLIKTINTRQVEFSQLKAGLYEYEIEDAAFNVWKDEIEITQPDQIDVNIQPIYFLDGNQTVNIQPASSANYTYTWSNSSGFLAEGSKITITKSGQYIVSAANQPGCAVSKSFSVLGNERMSAGNHAQLFPNPTNDGRFVVSVTLKETSDVKVTIYNTLGEKIYQKKLLNGNTYRLTEKLNQRGVYLILVETKFGSQVFKLVSQ